MTKYNGVTELVVLENAVRDHLNKVAPRVMGVLNPLKVVITNFPEGQVDYQDAINNPEDESQGSRKIPFTRELYIEHDDFMEEPPKKFFRLAPGREVRLRWGYFITCNAVIKDPTTGEIKELHCTYDPATAGGNAPDGRKVKATLHWVSAAYALNAEVRLYDKLFNLEDPNDIPEGKDFKDFINPDSLKILPQCKLEPSLKDAQPGNTYQFERLGYFCVDKDSTSDQLVFNRTVTLKDDYQKQAAKS